MWHRSFVARPAGIATRFAGFVFDVIAIFISFAIGGRVVEFVMSVLLRHQVRLAEAPTASTVALIVWAFVYCTVSLASSGQTPGMAILGVRVVDKDGRPLKTATPSCACWRSRSASCCSGSGSS